MPCWSFSATTAVELNPSTNLTPDRKSWHCSRSNIFSAKSEKLGVVFWWHNSTGSINYLTLWNLFRFCFRFFFCCRKTGVLVITVPFCCSVWLRVGLSNSLGMSACVLGTMYYADVVSLKRFCTSVAMLLWSSVVARTLLLLLQRLTGQFVCFSVSAQNTLSFSAFFILFYRNHSVLPPAVPET